MKLQPKKDQTGNPRLSCCLCLLASVGIALSTALALNILQSQSPPTSPVDGVDHTALSSASVDTAQRTTTTGTVTQHPTSQAPPSAPPRNGRGGFPVVDYSTATSHAECVCDDFGKNYFGPRSCVPVVENAFVTLSERQPLQATIHLFVDDDATFRDMQARMDRCTHIQFHVASNLVMKFVRGDRNLHAKQAAANCFKGSPEREKDVNDLLSWHVSQFGGQYGFNLFHSTFDCGAFQAWASWASVDRFVRQRMERTNHSVVGDITKTFNILSDTVRTPRRMNTIPKGVRAIFEAALHPLREFQWARQGASCTRFHVFGYYRVTTHIPWANRVDTSSPEVNKRTGDFADFIQQRMVERYGDQKPDPRQLIMFVDRRVIDNDGMKRARGIHPPLKRKLLEGASPALDEGGHSQGPTETLVVDISEHMDFKEQFHLVRSHPLIISSEGAYLAQMAWSPPNSTWIAVYNHTYGGKEGGKASNFAATLVKGLRNVRLIYYIIDNKQFVPIEELWAVVKRPWQQGVFFVGADEHGNRPGPG